MGHRAPSGGVLCFSEHEPGDLGPRRVTQDEIRASFAEGWRIDTIDPVIIEAAMPFRFARAWHATIARV